MSDGYLRTAVHAALTAGAILRHNRDRHHALEFKGATDLVTEMDRLSEQTILSIIRERFPGHGVVAEESGETSSVSAQDFTWYVDPLDGTTNYAHGFPWYAVSIALHNQGDAIVGVVYDPERDELFWSEKGRGAFCNNRRITVSPQRQLFKSLLATGFPYNIGQKRQRNLDNFSKVILAAQGIRRAGSAALDLVSVASGRLDGFWELGLGPWDTAAGELIVREAGGHVTTFELTKFNPQSASIIATNGFIHSDIAALLSYS